MDETQEQPDGGVEERTGEAIDHLRTAAHELIGAFRGFLDVAEELVDDPQAGEAVIEAVTSLADAARRGARSVTGTGSGEADAEAYQPIDLED
jgi:hypothetical protein